MAAWDVFTKVIRVIGITAAVIFSSVFGIGYMAFIKALKYFKESE